MNHLHKIHFFIITALFFFLGLPQASAHEAYVIPYTTFWDSIHGPISGHAFDALKNTQNIQVTLIIMGGVFTALFLNFLFRKTDLGKRFNNFFEKFSSYGPHFVRVAIALALILSAYTGNFLGPELPLHLMPFADIIRIALGVTGGMILFGVFVEIAAVIGIILFVVSFFIFGSYMMTYANYLGELIVLVLFGIRVFSIDRYILGPLKRFSNLKKYETLIIRIFYGSALIFAAITVKLLHPDLTIHVVNTWNLTQFHWLFPSDPLLITLGAGIVETVIGLFIIFGFEMRLTVLISLFYITLSLLFFKEQVWPHLLLYGISFNLLVQPETFTLDHLLFERNNKKNN